MVVGGASGVDQVLAAANPAPAKRRGLWQRGRRAPELAVYPGLEQEGVAPGLGGGVKGEAHLGRGGVEGLGAGARVRGDDHGAALMGLDGERAQRDGRRRGGGEVQVQRAGPPLVPGAAQDDPASWAQRALLRPHQEHAGVGGAGLLDDGHRRAALDGEPPRLIKGRAARAEERDGAEVGRNRGAVPRHRGRGVARMGGARPGGGGRQAREADHRSGQAQGALKHHHLGA